MSGLRCASAGVVATVLMTSVAAAGIIIDNFSNTFNGSPQFVTATAVVVSENPKTDSGPLAGVFGDGSRKLELVNISVSDDAIADTRVIPLSQLWATSNEDGADSAARVGYKSTLGATLLPLSGTPSDTLFSATVISNDLPLSLTASLKDVIGNQASWTWNISENQSTGLVVYRALGMFFFDPGNPGTFDFSQVTEIAVTMEGPSNWDGSVKLLETTAVPEPSSLLAGLAVTGIVGLAAARRRRKRA